MLQTKTQSQISNSALLRCIIIFGIKLQTTINIGSVVKRIVGIHQNIFWGIVKNIFYASINLNLIKPIGQRKVLVV